MQRPHCNFQGSWHKQIMQVHDEELIEDIRRLLDRPIVLVGMMGVGKSRTGRQIAGLLGLPFVDSDEEIEKAAGMTIAEIFERFGEEYFRDGERRVVQRLLEGGRSVIATGGGAVMNEETAAAIWEKTLSIWLRADLDVMVERTARKNDRPLLKDGDSRAILSALLEKRYPVYQKADIVIDSHNGPAKAILSQALEKIRDYLRHEQRKTG